MVNHHTIDEKPTPTLTLDRCHHHLRAPPESTTTGITSTQDEQEQKTKQKPRKISDKRLGLDWTWGFENTVQLGVQEDTFKSVVD